MDFTYDTENKSFFIELDDDFKAENVITYSMATKNPSADFKKCLKMSQDMELIHPQLSGFLYAQLESIPTNLIHQCLINLRQERELERTELQPDPQHTPDEAEGCEMFLELVENEIKQLTKYMKFSEETLKIKLCLGTIEISGQSCLANFFLDHVYDPVLMLNFNLDHVKAPPASEEEAAKPAIVPNNVVPLRAAKRTDDEPA
ncbi:MAG: hypothetical protein RSG77_26720 [Hafnia sp.]